MYNASTVQHATRRDAPGARLGRHGAVRTRAHRSVRVGGPERQADRAVIAAFLAPRRVDVVAHASQRSLDLLGGIEDLLLNTQRTHSVLQRKSSTTLCVV